MSSIRTGTVPLTGSLKMFSERSAHSRVQTACDCRDSQRELGDPGDMMLSLPGLIQRRTISQRCFALCARPAQASADEFLPHSGPNR